MFPGTRHHGIGVWWRFDFNEEVRSIFRERVSGRDDLSINVLELLGIAIGAYVFTVESEITPEYARNSMLMIGDKSSTVT